MKIKVSNPSSNWESEHSGFLTRMCPTLSDVQFTDDDGKPMHDVSDCRIIMKPGEPIVAWCKMLVSELDIDAKTIKAPGEGHA